jgi:hypothetical protein
MYYILAAKLRPITRTGTNVPNATNVVICGGVRREPGGCEVLRRNGR